ncbi:MAG: hypothetical protein FD135_662 [Comamonadaceae bacterium]|nr:MAG: hypothetical protein FD135_662 [Comamonadaceae bacterium]
MPISFARFHTVEIESGLTLQHPSLSIWDDLKSQLYLSDDGFAQSRLQVLGFFHEH